jgi:hypothetical protein
MQLVLQRTTTHSQQRLDEIVAAFTPAARRICPHLRDDILRDLVDRMAQRQLATERHRIARQNRLPARSRAIRPATRTSSLRPLS